MILSSSFSIVVIFYVILHVYSKEIDQKFVGSELLRKEANFYKLLEMAQHDNEDAQYLMNVKKSLDSTGKSIPSTVYKRMKMKVLKSLESDHLRRRTLHDEQVRQFHHVQCSPRIIPVEVPHPTFGFSFPAFIDLPQCVGGCAFLSPSIFGCAVTEKSAVFVSTFEFDTTTGEMQPKVEQMFNHTNCACECHVQEHHCNNQTEVYNAQECECKCKNLSHTCDNVIKGWNYERCECSCIEPPTNCNNNNKLWSPDTCDCQCLESIKKRCVRKNKLINKETCDCYCSPEIVCPAGTELQSYDCSCI